MQPMHQLERWLMRPETQRNTSLFHSGDFRSLYPNMSANAYRALIHRAERRGLLERVCQGVYQFAGNPDTSGRILFHAAALMRARHFNYISLEPVLSDAGVISQVPMVADQLTYDPECHLFRASVELAVDDMHRFNRHTTADLIQREEASDEYI